MQSPSGPKVYPKPGLALALIFIHPEEEEEESNLINLKR